MHRSNAVGRRNASTRKKKKLRRTHNISPLMGVATPGPTAINFGTVGDLVNVINRATFGTDRFTGFRSVKGRKMPFCILNWDCP